MTYPPPPPPQAPAPGAQQNNALGLIGMILGIVSIPLGCCFGAGALFGIAGVVLGFLGKKKADQGLANNRGMALAGIITGAIGVGVALLWVVFVVVFNVIDFSSYYTN